MVIATLNRPAHVLGLLESVPLDARALVDVIVVDQAPDRSLEAALSLSPDLPSLRYVHSLLRNASHARNLGAELARTSWVCFPDDDARLLPETLSRALPLLGEDIALVGGRIVNEQGQPHLIRWLEQDASITPETIDHCFVESAFFIRRDVLLSVGGFDPTFGPGSDFPSAEGADLLRRLWQRYPGLPSHYTPRISIYHPSKGQEQSHDSCQRVQQFAVGEGAFTARHHRQLPMLPIARRLLFRALAGCVSRGHKRRRKLAYTRGFWQGVRMYKAHSTPLSSRNGGAQ